MGLGGCIVLIAAGAILTFATDWQMKGVNLDLVGVILMVVGIIGIATFTSIARKRRMVMTQGQPMMTSQPMMTEEERIRRENGGY
ncbi:DUF6458 family protein [Streptomyces tsukubensis]|uniref:DUF6458 domain-containing protein n=1 Tax=Streptomyces tsukubensis TaxID=83656 RepID=A0A1V4A158_9ACTN|nr:DUF6458 family protein [Streptomyces tsukubensis]OON72925.1 hypothetical protein B1H18_28365 [Streptomyces tsukubensis]QFR94474.1 hypothetical protein GBW32_17265 [Streptomyces tsukubensis]